MKRNDHFFARGDMYRLVPSFKKFVKPGDRVELSLRGSLETDIVSALRAPAVASTYAFYVPLRLLWSGWEGFIADADTAAAIPTVATGTSPFAELGETGAFVIMPFYRRALKLIYNEFFGDLDYGAATSYTDPFLDTAQNSMLPLKTVNQLLSSIALDTDEPADNYSVVANSIELTEFRRRLRQNARQNNQRIGGEKYADALRRFGVEMREELASRPELLARQSEVIYPQEVFNTSDINTGSRVGRFRMALNFNVKRKFCMEHGIIVVLHSLRPFLARARTPFEASLTQRHWWMEEQEKAYREVNTVVIGVDTDVEPDPLVPSEKAFDLGDMLAINTPTGVLTYASTNAVQPLVYPTVAGTPKVEVAVSTVCTTVR